MLDFPDGKAKRGNSGEAPEAAGCGMSRHLGGLVGKCRRGA